MQSTTSNIERTICGNPVPSTNIPLIKALIEAIPGALLTVRPDGQFNLQLVIPRDDFTQYAICAALSEVLPAC